LASAKQRFDQDRAQFHQLVTAQANIRGLAAVIMIDGDLNIVDQSSSDIGQKFMIPSREVLKNTNAVEPQMGLFLDDNYVAAIIKLQAFSDMYLYVARILDPQGVAQLRATRDGLAQYQALEAQRIGVQWAFAWVFALIALIFLLLAFRIGINFANYLVAPIRRLIDA